MDFLFDNSVQKMVHLIQIGDDITKTQVKNFLNQNHLTVRQVARASDISASTLSNTFNRPLKSWKFSVIQGLAKSAHCPTDYVVHSLLKGGE